MAPEGRARTILSYVAISGFRMSGHMVAHLINKKTHLFSTMSVPGTLPTQHCEAAAPYWTQEEMARWRVSPGLKQAILFSISSIKKKKKMYCAYLRYIYNIFWDTSSHIVTPFFFPPLL